MAKEEPSLAGSSAWTCGEEYQDEYAVRIKRFLETFNQEALRRYASSLRGNRPCTISREFSVGNFNLLRKIVFEDGVEWVARLRMPALKDRVKQPCSMASSHQIAREAERKKILLEMKSELATMELLRRKTEIKIPKVHGYDLRDRNDIGCPFSILDYIHGNTAEEVSQSYPGDHRGIPVQFEEKFFRQVAKIMIQLASVRLPKIGSIFPDEADPNSESFVVGPLVETGTGPYKSIAEFYAKYPIELAKSLEKGEQQPIDGQEALVQAFLNVAATFVLPRADSHQIATSAGFGLANYDLNPNNILVDREFNVLAVIDWDSVVAVPDAALYRFPFLMGVDPLVPGLVDTHPAVLKRARLGQRFAEVVEAVGRELYDKGTFLFTKSGFFSKEAVAFRALVYLKMKQDWVNRDWVHGLKWLREHEEVTTAQF